MPNEALVAEAGGMGAPTVGLEKLDAFECEAALRGHFSGGNDHQSVTQIRVLWCRCSFFQGMLRSAAGSVPRPCCSGCCS